MAPTSNQFEPVVPAFISFDFKTYKCAGSVESTIYPEPIPLAPVVNKLAEVSTAPKILIVPGLTPPIVLPIGIRIDPLSEDIGTPST